MRALVVRQTRVEMINGFNMTQSSRTNEATPRETFTGAKLSILLLASALLISGCAHDIVQQTAIALWEKFDAYDPAQPFTPWACRFALNKYDP